MKPEPHHAHLAEMRADRADPIATIAVPCRALTGAELRDARARYAADSEADRLRQCYPDPTRRHLAEMRMTRARSQGSPRDVAGIASTGAP